MSHARVGELTFQWAVITPPQDANETAGARSRLIDLSQEPNIRKLSNFLQVPITALCSHKFAVDDRDPLFACNAVVT